MKSQVSLLIPDKVINVETPNAEAWEDFCMLYDVLADQNGGTAIQPAALGTSNGPKSFAVRNSSNQAAEVSDGIDHFWYQQGPYSDVVSVPIGETFFFQFDPTIGQDGTWWVSQIS